MKRSFLKKWLSLALAAALTVSLAGNCLAAVQCGKYSSWFKSSYTEMNQLKIIPDSFAGYDLTKDITRGEMCKLAVHASELITKDVIEPERTDYFSDTADLDIVRAYELGIVAGYPDGTFRPDQNLTRQEFFQIIQNFCNSAAFKPTNSGASLSRFKDASEIADWAVESTEICVKYGYVNGSGGMLDPAGNTSREEAMAMFLRCYKGLNEYYYGKVLSAKVVIDSGVDKNVTVKNASKTMYVTTDELNVRDAWSSTGTLVGTLKKGAAVTVTGICSNGWVRIKYNGFTAYVSGAYLSDTKGGSSSGGSGSGSGSGGTTVAASGKAAEIANYVLSFVGHAYVYGGSSPSGFDCSGLMYYCLKHFGYSMNRVADDQMNQGSAVSRDNLAVGDLVFFGSGSYASHVGMYIGNGNFVHAANPSSGVRISSLNETYYAKRFLTGRRIITD
jgi:cell wall-associated NlpC family hydrolase